MQERRVHPRVQEDLGIAVNVLAEGDSAPRLAKPAFHLTRDVSAGGLCFCHDRGIPPGTPLKVHVALNLPLVTLTHHARVRWSCAQADETAHRVGVEFMDGPLRDREMWAQFMDRVLLANRA